MKFFITGFRGRNGLLGYEIDDINFQTIAYVKPDKREYAEKTEGK